MRSRTLLYVPGDQPDKLDRCLDRGADGVILDLEDSVPPARRELARTIVGEWAAGRTGCPQLWVRVNEGPAGAADIAALAGLPAITGFVIAKASGAAQLREIDAVLTRCGSAAHVVPLLETAAAVWDVADIAGAPRVLRLQVGEADLRAELGIEPGDDERELLWIRSRVVVASAVAGLAPPIAPASTQVRDLEALRASTIAVRRLGFGGRTCIHPAQLPVVAAVFTPRAEDVVRARDLLARFEAAGGAPLLDDAGRMVDLAVVKQARRIVENADPEGPPTTGA